MSELYDEEKDELSEAKESASNVKNKFSEVKNKGKQAKDIAKKFSKEAVKKAGKEVGKQAGKLAAKAGSKAIFANPYVLAITLIVILILIIIIGICGFFATMPGLMSGKLKQIAQGVADAWQTLYKTGADARVNKSDIVDTAEYIRSMGYDLIGYGFIPARNLSQDSSISKGLTEDGHLKDASGNVRGDSGTYYDEYGIGYATTGTETGVEGSFETAGTVNDYLEDITDVSILKTYALSDMRLYCIRNYDAKIDTINTIHDWFLDNDSDWAGGLLSLYHAKDYIATGEYEEVEAGYIRAYPSTKTMKIKVGWNTNEMEFGLDGWSGRYGLSLEFLLSLHLATMAPELVTTMARTFDTEVQIYLDEVKQRVTGYYKDENTPDYITYSDIVDHDGRWIGNKDAYDLMKKYGIKSQEEGIFACTNAVDQTIVYINGSEGNVDKVGTNEKVETFADLIAGEQKAKMKDMFYFEGDDKIPGSNWYDFFTNHTDNYQSDKHTNGGVWYNNVDAFAKFTNNSMQWMYDNYGHWFVVGEVGEDGYWKTFEQYASEKGGLAMVKLPRAKTPEEGFASPTCEDGWSIVNYESFSERLEKYIPFKEFSTLQKNTMEEFDMITLSDYKYPNNQDDASKLRLSTVIFRTSGDSNCNVAVVVYKEPSDNEKIETKLCTDGSGPEACQNCENYVQAIRDALYKITEDGTTMRGEFKTYNPYIARVVDSWFRDTYFVIPDDDGATKDTAIQDVYKDENNTKSTNYGDSSGEIKLSGQNIEFVEFDNEYLEETDEYWTKYETATNSNGETVYVLYELKDNGTLGTDKYLKDIDSEGREVYIKNGNTSNPILVENSNLNLVKKIYNESGKKITDKWNEKTTEDGYKVWTVYAGKTQHGRSDYYELDVTNKSDSNIKKVAKYTSNDNYERYFYYTYEDRVFIEQQEDGRRGITNPIIKKMFKNRKYYIYDGTSETAEAIYKDWKKVVDTNFGGNEEAAEKAIDNYYYNGTGSDPRNPDLIGNITINKDTLNAFSILENTNTLDSDYQYRDFKELIVELDYFDKEDLSDKVEEVFTWIMPEHQEKWPLRLIDKSEEHYGTLIHSDKALVKIKQDLGIETADPADPAAPVETEEDDDEAIGEIKNATGYTQDIDIVSPVTGEVISYGTYKRENTDLIKEYEEQGKNKQDLVDQGIQIEEEVGFIQIRALEKPDIFTSSNCSGDISVDVEGKNYSFSKEKVWNSYYEEYEDVCEGYIVTIDGIKLLELDNGTKITSLEELISNANNLETADGIKPNVTPNLVDDEKEKENQAKENAKIELEAAKVIPTTDGNKLYIKEGTKIGKTTYSTEFPDYSYTRIILRNEKLEIQEDVEKYFDLPISMMYGASADASVTALSASLGGGSQVGNDTYNKAMQYWDTVQKYSAEYGVDPYLVIAMMCQESSANPNSDNGCAYGLMQWEYSSNGTSITVTKADGTTEKITGITKDRLSGDTDFQIKVGCAELKNKLDKFGGNTAVGLQGYNFGEAGVKRCVAYYLAGQKNCRDTSKRYCGVSEEEVMQYIATGDTGWLSARQWYKEDGHNYFSGAGGGDPQYLEHVLQYYNNGGTQ